MNIKKKTEDRITFRIDEDTQCLIDKYMEKEEKNKSEALRVLIKTGLRVSRIVEDLGQEWLEALEKDLGLKN